MRSKERAYALAALIAALLYNAPTSALASETTYMAQMQEDSRRVVRSTGLPEGDAERGKAIADSVGCFRCHGADGHGRGKLRPNLAGQNQPYLVKQLLAFRDGMRKSDDEKAMGFRWHPGLSTLTAPLRNQDLADLAAHYAAQACVSGNLQRQEPPPVVARCKFCHGLSGRSKDPVIPNLAGQKPLYLLRQLEAFRKGGREVTAMGDVIRRSHPIMNKQIFHLSDADVVVLAAYFGSLPCK